MITDPLLMALPNSIRSLVPRKLHLLNRHPINTISLLIKSHFPSFSFHSEISPIVTAKLNFDSLLIPKTHPSRSKSDTYYLNHEYLLRTHTSAHQTELIAKGENKFLVVGDVYRRDEIDSCHYPVFHQMEGVCLYDIEDLRAKIKLKGFKNKEEIKDVQDAHKDSLDEVSYLVTELKFTLEQLIQKVFNEPVKSRWSETYFPFTSPSFEMEIFYNNKWIEVLGCGIVSTEISKDKIGWAFGLGLERLAMILFDINDIRLFWSKDERFMSQFDGSIKKFKEFSKYPGCFKDVSFWSAQGFVDLDFYEIVRENAGDLVEDVKLIDEFKKGDQKSKCFRITFRAMDRTLRNGEVDELMEKIRNTLSNKVQLR